MPNPWLAKLWAGIRMMAIKSTVVSSPNAPGSWQALTLHSTSGQLLTRNVLTGKNNTPLDQDANNRLTVVPYGSQANPWLQDSNNSFIIAKAGAITTPSTIATVHLSTGADTLIFSAPGTQIWCSEQILLANNNVLTNTITLSRSTAGNASRLFVGPVAGQATIAIDSPIYIRPGKPLRGSGTAAGGGCTVNMEGYRVK